MSDKNYVRALIGIIALLIIIGVLLIYVFFFCDDVNADMGNTNMQTEESADKKDETKVLYFSVHSKDGEPDSGNAFVDSMAAYDKEDKMFWIKEETLIKEVQRGRKYTFKDAKRNNITINASCEFSVDGKENAKIYVKVLTESGKVVKEPGLYVLNKVTQRTKSQMEELILVKDRNGNVYWDFASTAGDEVTVIENENVPINITEPIVKAEETVKETEKETAKEAETRKQEETTSKAEETTTQTEKETTTQRQEEETTQQQKETAIQEETTAQQQEETTQQQEEETTIVEQEDDTVQETEEPTTI